LIVVFGLLALALLLPMSGGMLGFGEAGPGPSGGSPRPTTAAVTGVPQTSAAVPSEAAPSAPAATPGPTPIPTGPLADIAVVPVTQFRATAVSTNRDEVAAVLAG